MAENKVNVTDALLDFVEAHRTYDTLPQEVIDMTKTLVFDAVSNTLGGIASDKGKIGIQFAKMNGGFPEATVYGTGEKVSAAVAAFANGEMQNGLDYDPVPHIPPILMPSVMAVAEQQGSTGKELITALSVGGEVAIRLSDVLMNAMRRSLAQFGKTPDVFGNSNEHVIGAAVACGMLLGLDREKLAQCIGISAGLCSLPICRDWESTMPKTMIKYFPAAWLAHIAVCSAQLASLGYTGNAYTLDSEFGFPAIYCRVPGVWEPEEVIRDIGKTWKWLNMGLKPYPACRYLHSDLDCFYKLLNEHHFGPDEIDEIRCYSATFVAHPDQMAVSNQIDAQFSGPYSLAMILYGYEVGPAWQNKAALHDPRIRNFMSKVKMLTSEHHYELKKKDPLSWYAKVEIDARGQTYTAECDYSTGTNRDGFRITQEDLDKRFFNNAQIILPTEKIEKAIEQLKHLEDFDDLQEVIKNFVL